MKTKLRTPAIFFLILSLFVPGCILVSPKTTADSATAIGGTSIPPFAELVPSTQPPTDAPTATVYPPVFDPDAIGDNRELASFVLTRNKTTTGAGEVDIRQGIIGYIKEPFSAYNLSEFSFTGSYDVDGEDKTYWIDDRFYHKDANEAWYFYLEAGLDEKDILQRAADMRDFNYLLLSGLVLSAQFVGQEDFKGIPANHFTFDQTNLRQESDPSGTYKVDVAQGDLYLAQDGNYLLYFYLKRTGNLYSPGGSSKYFPGMIEMSEELSSINELTEIVVPPDFLALDLNLGGLPLPAGTVLTYIYHPVNDGLGVDSYIYSASVSHDEFLEFYKNMASTNGWTFSHIGEVANHIKCDTIFGGVQDCAILYNGNEQIFLSHYEGYIIADHDNLHVYDSK
jgi:hypothetical protein